jgi:hypothetical protein
MNIVALTATPPPQLPPDATFIACMSMCLLIIATLDAPPPNFPSIRNRILGEQIDAVNWEGRDLHQYLLEQPFTFWTMTGETPDSFRELFGRVHPYMFGERRRRAFTLSAENRLVLTLIWLRQYPGYAILSVMFNISTTTVGEIINHIWPILWQEIAPNVQWHSERHWRNLRGNWSTAPNAVGAIDGTSHRILRPSTEPQHEFYSGHRNMHCMHTQVRSIRRYFEKNLGCRVPIIDYQTY